MKVISDKIRAIRLLKGLTQENMAHELGLSSEGFGKIERGETKLRLDVLDKIADIFQMRPADVLNFDPGLIIQGSTDRLGILPQHTPEGERIRALSEEVRFLREEILFLKGKLLK